MNTITTTNITMSTGSFSPKKSEKSSDIKREKSAIEGKIRSLSSKKGLSEDEKKVEKGRLEEKLRSLDNELTSSKAMDAHDKANEGPGVTKSPQDINKEEQEKRQERREEEAKQREEKFGEAEQGVIVSLSNAKDRLADMEQLRTKMKDELRTAETEEEKKEITKKLARVEAQIDTTRAKAEEDIDDYNKQLSGKPGKKKADDGSGEFSFLNEKENISLDNKSDSSIGTRYYRNQDQEDSAKLIIS